MSNHNKDVANALLGRRIEELDKRLRNIERQESHRLEYSTFSPSWTAPTTNPSIADGSLDAVYYQAGKLVLARYLITWGASTTAGSGAWSLSLPFTEVALQFSGTLEMNDITGNFYFGVCHISSTGLLSARFDNQTNHVNLSSANMPFTPASGDWFSFTIPYIKV